MQDEFLPRCVVDPSSRTIYLYSSEGEEKILAFYKEALSQLGWKFNRDGEFLRGEEILTIDFLPDGDYLAIRFSLEPR